MRRLFSLQNKGFISILSGSTRSNVVKTPSILDFVTSQFNKKHIGGQSSENKETGLAEGTNTVLTEGYEVHMKNATLLAKNIGFYRGAREENNEGTLEFHNPVGNGNFKYTPNSASVPLMAYDNTIDPRTGNIMGSGPIKKLEYVILGFSPQGKEKWKINHFEAKKYVDSVFLQTYKTSSDTTPQSSPSNSLMPRVVGKRPKDSGSLALRPNEEKPFSLRSESQSSNMMRRYRQPSLINSPSDRSYSTHHSLRSDADDIEDTILRRVSERLSSERPIMQSLRDFFGLWKSARSLLPPDQGGRFDNSTKASLKPTSLSEENSGTGSLLGDTPLIAPNNINNYMQKSLKTNSDPAQATNSILNSTRMPSSSLKARSSTPTPKMIE